MFTRLATHHCDILKTILSFFGHLGERECWRRPVVDRIARQMIFSGMEALPLLCLAGLSIGGMMAHYGGMWLDFTRRSDLLYPLVTGALLREVSPLMAVLLALAASGAPMCAEMAMMRVTGEVDLLRSQGICAFRYLAFPRMAGLALACACGAVVTGTAALLACAAGLAQAPGEPGFRPVLAHLLLALNGRDAGWMLVKAAAGGVVVAACACATGLSAGRAKTEIPRMVASGMTVAAGWIVLLWGALSWASYLR